MDRSALANNLPPRIINIRRRRFTLCRVIAGILGHTALAFWMTRLRGRILRLEAADEAGARDVEHVVAVQVEVLRAPHPLDHDHVCVVHRHAAVAEQGPRLRRARNESRQARARRRVVEDDVAARLRLEAGQDALRQERRATSGELSIARRPACSPMTSGRRSML